jgi:hypothetical protein
MLKISVERPVVGSPLSIADCRHFTSLSGENFTDVDGARCPIFGEGRAADEDSDACRQRPVRLLFHAASLSLRL